jgi:Tfp pilus assembly protein PilZ
MMAPESNRVLNDERTVAQAEAARSSEEQALWQRAQAFDADPAETRVQAVLSRIVAIESGGHQSPDLGRARGVLEAALTPDRPLAVAERSAAIAARKAAVQAREAATKALVAAVAQVETRRAAQRKDLGAIEAYLTKAERRLAGSSTVAELAPAASPVAATAAVVAPVANEAAATVAMAAPAPLSAPRAPPVRPGFAAPNAAPVAAIPQPVEPPAVRSFEPQPAAGVEPMSAPELRSGTPGPGAIPGMSTTGTSRKVSKRRRVRLAPPPKKLDVEVAVYGDNTFYTGFDNQIASGGVFVATLETLPEGHELELSITIDGKEIRAQGRVAFVRADNTANPECTPGAGIKLLNLTPDSVKLIETFFKERPPMFVVTR